MTLPNGISVRLGFELAEDVAFFGFYAGYPWESYVDMTKKALLAVIEDIRLAMLGKQDRLFDGISATSAGRMLVKCAKNAGLPAIRVHDLRHSHAGLLIELGNSPLLIAERLGHKNPTVTLNI